MKTVSDKLSVMNNHCWVLRVGAGGVLLNQAASSLNSNDLSDALLSSLPRAIVFFRHTFKLASVVLS